MKLHSKQPLKQAALYSI